MAYGALGNLLTRKATFLIGIESALGVNPGLTLANAVEVKAPEFTVDLNVIERQYVSNDLSPFEHQAGRVISGFKVEMDVAGNGRQQSGLLADAPPMALMMRACGYRLVAMTTAGTDCHSPITPDSSNALGAIIPTFASQAAVTSVDMPVLYTIEVTTGGATGVARMTVSSNTIQEHSAQGDFIAAPTQTAVLTSGTTPIPLGAKGGSLIATWTGALTAGTKFYVCCFPRGIKAVPRSDAFETVAMELNMDGVKHEGVAGVGTFTIAAPAGGIANAVFNFTTRYIEPVDQVMPDPDFGNNPMGPQVEEASFTWGGNQNLTVEQFSFDAATQIEARPSVNHPLGYAGSRILGRAPQIGFNPEATKVADYNFWREFTLARSKAMVARIGRARGNQVAIYCGKAQTSDQSYTDRNGTRALGKTAMLKRLSGDDEVIFVFC